MGYPPGAGPAAGMFAYGAPTTLAEATGPAAGPAATLPYILYKEASPDPVETSKQRAVIGRASVTGRGWMVQRVTVSGTAAAIARVYVGGERPEHLIAGTPAGAMDDYDAARMIPVPAGQDIRVIWEGSDVAPEAEFHARIEYWEL